jgi:hypothetical protein
VRDGLAIAREKGVTLGRPIGSTTVDEPKILLLLKQGPSIRKVARAMGIAPNTVISAKRRSSAA